MHASVSFNGYRICNVLQPSNAFVIRENCFSAISSFPYFLRIAIPHVIPRFTNSPQSCNCPRFSVKAVAFVLVGRTAGFEVFYSVAVS